MTINFLNIAQVLVAIALIGFILIQRGPGATAGSAFGGGGGGASGTVFGAKGSGSFLTKATAILATLFFIITMLIAIDARDAYSASDQAQQDLGVFGTLDSDDSQPAVNSTDSAGDQLNEIIDAADQSSDQISGDLNESANQAEEALDDTIEAAAEQVDAAADEVKETAQDITDDGDNN